MKPRAAKILGINAYMKLGDSDFEDEHGVVHEQPIPEGFHKADHIFWNMRKEDLVEAISKLPRGPRYKVTVVER